MKKYFLLVVFFLFAKLGSAQYSLVFCEDVNSEGKPEMVSNSFMVDGDGGVLKFLLKTEDYFNTDKLDFRVFYLSEEGTEEEISRLPQRVLPTWNFAWKEMVMFDPGNYRVKVFTSSGTYLTSANLNVPFALNISCLFVSLIYSKFIVKTKIVVLTGAGISAESGIKTFRDSGGLWENHRVEDVASPEGWCNNQQLVLNFYNERRKQLLECKPNRAHFALAELERKYEVTIITQNVDDLHERAGSTNVIHLHGELLKARSCEDENLIYDWNKDIMEGDVCERGSQLRPHIVWFGEAVPLMETAVPIVREAAIFIVVGTSLVVYPAAGLVNYTRYEIPKWLIDANDMPLPRVPNLKFIHEKATIGVDYLVNLLLTEN